MKFINVIVFLILGMNQLETNNSINEILKKYNLDSSAYKSTKTDTNEK